MTIHESKSLAERAKALYEDRIRKELGLGNHGKYVAIEPDSRDYFVAETFGEAIRSSRNMHPDKLAFVIRVGHEAAIHLGVMSS